MSLVLCVLPYLLRHILIMGGSMHFGPKAKVKKKKMQNFPTILINNNKKKKRKEKKRFEAFISFGDFYVLLACFVFVEGERERERDLTF